MMSLCPARRLPLGSCRGFTLIELLVALFIAAVMFAMGYGAINQALNDRGDIRSHEKQLLALETTLTIMEQDFVQLAPRPVRNPDGEGYEPCLVAASAGAGAQDPGAANPLALVTFTRAGWSNPIGLPRSQLERVAYVFDQGTLVREHWNVLDATLQSLPVKRNLLKGLRSVSFRYMSVTRSWLDSWPPAGMGTENAQDAYYRMRPLAVEVTLDTKQWGKIVRIFEIPG